MQAERQRTSPTGIVDFHNHVIPGVDDGATDLEQSSAALEALRQSGVRALVATPHLDGALTRQPEELAERLAELDAGWRRLSELGAASFPDLELHRGVELMLNTPVPDLSDPRLRLAGGPFVLIEFPYMAVPPNSAHFVAKLRMEGWRPIIAHPERYAGLDAKLEVVERWRRAGAHLQVNAGSLLGRYGAEAGRVALEVIERGWADYLGSDYHARGRVWLRSARESLEALGGEEQARLLMETNPARVLAGEAPVPVPPLQPRRGLWARIAKAFR